MTQRGDFDAPTPVPAAARDTWRDRMARELWDGGFIAGPMGRAFDAADAVLPVLVAAQREAAAREADNTADTVLALADDMLAHWPDGGENPDLDEVYDWWIAQASALRAGDAT